MVKEISETSDSNTRVVISQELSDALVSKARYPIKLDSLVELLRYKHISSLTTHLKRHFNKDKDYKVTKQTPSSLYHISVNCFLRICGYVRHHQRKEIAQSILKLTDKMGINKKFKKRPNILSKLKLCKNPQLTGNKVILSREDEEGGEDKGGEYSDSCSSPESDSTSYSADDDSNSSSASGGDIENMDICIPHTTLSNTCDDSVQQNLKNIEYTTTNWRQRRLHSVDFKLADLNFFNDYLDGNLAIIGFNAEPLIPAPPGLPSLADVERTFQVWQAQKRRISAQFAI